ncbi:MAG: glycoside hydrolase family 15 [Muribaculum sp.]|nr:glycoside hydrolase family 15 [Muribaculum sp.]
METLYELWGKRNPNWEEKYQDSVISVFADYGKGVNKYNEVKGKTFGAGYEVFILAFFIGLYYNQTKPLIEDTSKVKNFGWAISNWGTQESRLGRTQYPRLREYMFAALIARTDVDLIALDKGEIKPSKVVDQLIDKMEQYANFGFSFIKDKLEDDPNYFFKDTAFLRVFLSFLPHTEDSQITEVDEDEIEEI